MELIKQSIHSNSKAALSVGDFNKNQQVLDLLNKFILDYGNVGVFRSVILDDCNPETTFVLYSLFQKCILNGEHFVNLPHQHQEYFYNEYDHRLNTSDVCTNHIDIALKYLQQGHQHPGYVRNQVMFTVALILRKFWLDINKIDDLVDNIIKSTFQSQVFFKLFENVISCVRQYNYANGYIEYRKVLNSFQTVSLSRIVQATMMHLNTLKGTSLLGHVNKPLVEAFLSLLHEILNLNFNYSYYEIDMDHDQKDQLTNYPDFYLPLIVDQYFLEELFRDSIGFLGVDMSLSVQCIHMLQRISCVRLSIFSNKKCKGAFRNTLWNGLLYVYRNYDIFCKYPDFAQEIHSLAIKIINNLTLRKLHKFQDLFDQCLQLMSTAYIKTITDYGMPISPNNQCIRLQELWNQIGYQLQLHRPLNDQENTKVGITMQNLLVQVLQQFFKGTQYAELPPEYSVKKFKKLTDLIFQPFHGVFKQKICENIGILALMVEQLKINFNQEQCSAMLCLVQVFLLHSAPQDLNLGFDSYQFGAKEEPSPNTSRQAHLIKFAIEMIGKPIQKSKVLQMSLLSFIESFTLLTIDSLCYDNSQFKNISQLYCQLVTLDASYTNYILVLEKMLEEWYSNQLFSFQVFTCFDPIVIEYSLKLIEIIYQKTKRYIPRRIYRQCTIVNMLKQFFLQLEITCLNTVQYIKKRALIFKIITVVWIDDQSDEYIQSLVEIYTQIKKSLNQVNKVNMLKYIWDLIGIASQIDVDNIYRAFLRIIYPDLSLLLVEENIEVFAKDYDSSMAIITLFQAIFYNKNTRLSNENIQLILYQIYGKAMKFFIILCSLLKTITTPTDAQLKQTSNLLLVMGQISGSKLINQGFFIIYNDQTFLELLKQQLQLIRVYRPLLIHIPKYRRRLSDCFDNICQEHPETLAYKCELDSYLEIFTICLEYLRDIINDNKGEDSINENCATLILIGNLLSNISQFLIQEASVGHPSDLQMIKNKIEGINTQGKTILCDMFNLSCQLTLVYPKNSKIIFAIPEILYAISIFNPREFHTYLITLLTNQIGSQVNQLLDSVASAFKNLEGELQTSGKEDFIRKVKGVLEMYK